MLAARLRICIYFESLIEIPSIEKNDIFLKKPRLHLLTSPKYFCEFTRAAGAIHITASMQSSLCLMRSQATFVLPLPIPIKRAPAFSLDNFSTALRCSKFKLIYAGLVIDGLYVRREMK